MENQSEKEQIKANIKWESDRNNCIGGQHTGFIRCKQTLVSEELDLKISIGFHRSMLRNRELAMTLFELAMDELIK